MISLVWAYVEISGLLHFQNKRFKGADVSDDANNYSKEEFLKIGKLYRRVCIRFSMYSSYIRQAVISLQILS